MVLIIQRCVLLLACTAVLAAMGEPEMLEAGDSVTFLEDFVEAEPAEKQQEKAEPGEKEKTPAKSEAEAVPYKVVTDVENAINEASEKKTRLQARANELMDEEVHTVKQIGKFTLAQDEANKEFMDKRYTQLHKERLDMDKEEHAKQVEINDLKKELTVARGKHERGYKIAKEKDEKERVKFLNERAHKRNTKEEAYTKSLEKKSKAQLAAKGEQVIQDTEAKESKNKIALQAEMINDGKRDMLKIEASLAKDKFSFTSAKNQVKAVASHIKNSRDESAYNSHINKYRQAVHVERAKQATFKIALAQKAKVEKRLEVEQTKFNEEQALQKQAQKKARENHRKLVSGRQSNNCHNSCRLYRVATDTESNDRRGKKEHKTMCFGEKNSEPPGTTVNQKAQKEEKKEAAKPQSQEDAAKPEKLLGEAVGGAGCQGMSCKCATYTKFDANDPQRATDDPGHK